MNEEFNKSETLEITRGCYVAGGLKKPGDKVTVSGNAKSQLLSSKRAVKYSKESKQEGGK